MSENEDTKGLEELVAKLDTLGREEQRDLSEAEGLELASGRAEQKLLEQVLLDTGASATPLRPFLWLIAAAAAAVLIFLFNLGGPSERDPSAGGVPGDTLLGTGLELQAPVGSVASFALFEWSAPLPERGWFQVQVWGDSGNGYRFLTKSPRLTDARWAPDPGELEEWPRSIRWKLEVYRGTGAGDLVDSDFATAEL